MRVDEIIRRIDRIMAQKVIKDQSATSISRNEVEKKVNYILSHATKPLVLNNDDFLEVKAAFINRIRLNRNEDLRNRLTELSGGRKRRTRKYKK
jgi:ABC-type glutathione transport system ATPase component